MRVSKLSLNLKFQKFAKKFKIFMKMQNEANSRNDLKKGKKSFSMKNRENFSLKSSQVECFNHRGK